MSGVNMDKKLQEVNKYLYGCFTVEKEVNLLYVATTKKIPSTQLSVTTTALAYNHQKNAAVIREILNPLIRTNISYSKLTKEYTEGVEEIRKLRNALDMKDNMEHEEVSDILKDLATIEDYLDGLYADLIESEFIENYSYTFSELTGLTNENLEYMLQALKQDNIKHKEMLIEATFYYNKNQQRNVDTTPIVKYQNPNAWVQL
jgi:hypothetical protein